MLQKKDNIQNTKLLEWVQELELRFPVAEICEKTGYSSGIVSEYLGNKKKVSENFLREFKKAFGIADQSPSPSESKKNKMSSETKARPTDQKSSQSIALEQLAESNRLMAEANKIQAEANRIQAESNRQLVESNRELTAMIRGSVTAGAGPEIPAAVAAKFEDLLLVVAEVASGKRYKSRSEAFAEMHRLFYDTGQDVQHAGTFSDADTHHISK